MPFFPLRNSADQVGSARRVASSEGNIAETDFAVRAIAPKKLDHRHSPFVAKENVLTDSTHCFVRQVYKAGFEGQVAGELSAAPNLEWFLVNSRLARYTAAICEQIIELQLFRHNHS